jgi:hypothetical protein
MSDQLVREGHAEDVDMAYLVPTNFELGSIPSRILVRRSLYMAKLRFVRGAVAVDIQG